MRWEALHYIEFINAANVDVFVWHIENMHTHSVTNTSKKEDLKNMYAGSYLSDLAISLSVAYVCVFVIKFWIVWVRWWVFHRGQRVAGVKTFPLQTSQQQVNQAVGIVLSFLKKYSCFWPLLTEVWDEHDSFSAMLFPCNLELFTCSTSALLL